MADRRMSHLPVILSYLTVAALTAITLKQGLIAPVLFGFLVFMLVRGAEVAIFHRLSGSKARRASVALVAGIILGLICLLIAAGFHFGGAHAYKALMIKLATTLEQLRGVLPPVLSDHLPEDAGQLLQTASAYLKEHASLLGQAGITSLRILAGSLICGVIGAMIAASAPVQPTAAFARELHLRFTLLGNTFAKIVAAQAKISAVNTLLTGCYLLLVLPALGLSIPFAKTLVVLTFVVGLIPVAGNLISNTAIFLASLSVSWPLAAGSLLYLVAIHKLEYFLNARIVGTQVDARAWELLIAMLACETLFGVGGVVAAPILYAYMKYELKRQNWI
jgi:predicted PurR-regulated permease PerM